MNRYSKFHPNRTLGKRSKLGGNFRGAGGEFGGGRIQERGRISEKNANVTNVIPKSIYVGYLIQIGQWKNCPRLKK